MKLKFDYLTAAVDVSRNSALKMDQLKRFIDLIAKMGYNSLTLYTEDMFEMPEYPMFGYMRGRYSKEDLKELVAYAEARGIEMIPNVRILAHLEHLFMWNDFRDIHDTKDILLADEEKSYALIENMFKTMREIYKTDYILLGCDEAEMLGLGNYMKKHGYTPRREIFKRHLYKCVDMARQYGFTHPKVSGDMFFKIANAAAAGEEKYYTDDPDVITDEVVELLPEGAIFGYWDYFSDKNIVESMLTASKRFKAPVLFSCSCLTWSGFFPHNIHAMDRMGISLNTCIEKQVERVTVTFWGDDGAEASVFSSLPAWFYAAQVSHGINDMDTVKKNFYEMFHIRMDDFCKLDYTSDYTGDLNNFHSEKCMLYNDPFCGVYDDMVKDNAQEVKDRFCSHAEELRELVGVPEYGYLFDTAASLCDLMAVKFDLGKRTRALYQTGDREGLRLLLADYAKAAELTGIFYGKFRDMWYRERKGNGFEIQILRLAGLKERLLDCRDRLERYVLGSLSAIEELESEVRDIHNETSFKDRFYGKIATVNAITHWNLYGLW